MKRNQILERLRARLPIRAGEAALSLRVRLSKRWGLAKPKDQISALRAPRGSRARLYETKGFGISDVYPTRNAEQDAQQQRDSHIVHFRYFDLTQGHSRLYEFGGSWLGVLAAILDSRRKGN